MTNVQKCQTRMLIVFALRESGLPWRAIAPKARCTVDRCRTLYGRASRLMSARAHEFSHRLGHDWKE